MKFWLAMTGNKIKMVRPPAWLKTCLNAFRFFASDYPAGYVYNYVELHRNPEQGKKYKQENSQRRKVSGDPDVTLLVLYPNLGIFIFIFHK